MKPNDALAERIAQKLLEEDLIDPQDQVALLERLKTGSASAEDWVVWAEKRIDPNRGDVPDED